MTEKYELLRDKLYDTIKKVSPYFDVSEDFGRLNLENLIKINEILDIPFEEEFMELIRRGYIEPFIFKWILDLAIKIPLAMHSKKGGMFAECLAQEIFTVKFLIKNYLDGKYGRITD